MGEKQRDPGRMRQIRQTWEDYKNGCNQCDVNKDGETSVNRPGCASLAR